MVFGLTGLKKSRPALKAVAIGEQPSACAPLILVRTASTNPNALHFVQALPNLRQQGAGRHGNDGLIRRAPAELFDGLKGQRLRPFGIVGSYVDVDEGPAMLAGNLAAKPVHIIVVAFNLDDIRLVDQIAEHLRGFKIGRNKT